QRGGAEARSGRRRLDLDWSLEIDERKGKRYYSVRYGVQSIEWVIFTVMTTVVLIGTLVIILLPVTQKGMMEEVPLPPSMKRSEDMIRESLHLLFPFVQMKRSEDDTRTPASSI
uniref:Uncharacterized protein n=1 Tax=Oryza glaberrima TaxID=4538 RepID=I1QCD6_ORYGL